MRVGNYLKQAREEKNVTLDTVSHKTKINTKSLTALENNEFDQLPNKVYVLAYVKNYCKSLNIDNSKALELLSEEYETVLEDEQVNEIVETPPQKFESQSDANEFFAFAFQKLSDKRVIFAAIFLIVLVSITFKVKEIVDRKLPTSAQNLNEQATDDPEDNNEVITPQDKNELDELIKKDVETSTVVDVSPKKESKNEATAKKEITPVKKDETEVISEKKEIEETKKVEVTSNEDKEKLSEELKKYKPIQNTMYLLESDAVEVNDPDIYPLSFKNQVAPDKHNVFVTALFDDVWYRYKIDNDPVKQNTLKQGKKILLKGDDTVMIFIGNFFATKVIYNNALVNGKAPAGVKSLIFPHDKRTDYFLPLFAKDKDGKSITSKEFVEANSN